MGRVLDAIDSAAPHDPNHLLDRHLVSMAAMFASSPICLVTDAQREWTVSLRQPALDVKAFSPWRGSAGSRAIARWWICERRPGDGLVR